MVEYFTLILCCQLIGELLVSVLNLPLPGSVAGMILLFVFLLIRGRTPVPLARLSDN